MPTILEQAEVIRDETGEYANIPERVGTCLVDIANALAAIQPASVNSAGFSQYANAQTFPVDDSIIPVEMDNCFKVKTGSGVDNFNVNKSQHFGNMDPLKAYNVSFSICFMYDAGIDLGFSLRDIAGNPISGCQVRPLQGKGFSTSDFLWMTISAMVTGTETCALFIHPIGGTTFSLNACDASIVDCGLAVWPG